MNIQKKNQIWAEYFGLRVEVVSRMEQCSLILYLRSEFIVDTADLVFAEGALAPCQSLQRAA